MSPSTAAPEEDTPYSRIRQDILAFGQFLRFLPHVTKINCVNLFSTPQRFCFDFLFHHVGYIYKGYLNGDGQSFNSVFRKIMVFSEIFTFCPITVMKIESKVIPVRVGNNYDVV